MADEGNPDETVFEPPFRSFANKPAPNHPARPLIASDVADGSIDSDITLIATPGDAAGLAKAIPVGMPYPVPPPPGSGSLHVHAIQVGSRLNHMFDVTRFIARGGMGEVFEGVNITNEERIAIKVIRPELAADPSIIAMFRKEAHALMNLSHPALVRYRVQAQEPVLGCFYIVTGFISGMSLAERIGTQVPELAELVALTRRLAEGLKEAHDAGIIHRDISPDNILLESDRLDRARIIDFGIVKDTGSDAVTVIGSGFAGKMRYAAPEQLGDFDQNVGPWSDIYSLALVVLALAQGRPTDLGGLPASALAKRRAGIDTGGAPEALRSVLDRMLMADPAQRIRSMDDVISALGMVGKGESQPNNAVEPAASSQRPLYGALRAGAALLIGGVLFLVAMLAGFAIVVLMNGR